jgi:uncharacterized membrane protein YtjA (UPF0391 family)
MCERRDPKIVATIVAFILAIVCAVLGFGGLPADATKVTAQVGFFVFLLAYIEALVRSGPRR